MKDTDLIGCKRNSVLAEQLESHARILNEEDQGPGAVQNALEVLHSAVERVDEMELILREMPAYPRTANLTGGGDAATKDLLKLERKAKKQTAQEVELSGLGG